MKPPSQEEVVAYAAELGATPTVAATYHAYGVGSDWHMRDGAKVRDWKVCLRLWLQKMQGRPGFEIVLHDKPHGRQTNKKDREKSLLRRERIIIVGRKKNATDEQIEKVLAKYGLTW